MSLERAAGGFNSLAAMHARSDPPPAHDALRLSELRFRYGATGPAPWTVDVGAFSMERGEQVLMTGGSGAGKSTLLYLIAGLLEPTSGHAEVDGQDIHALSGAARDRFRGRRIGMIFQTFNLLIGFSASENVEAALLFADVPAREHKPRARALLERLGIDRPDAEASTLSVGQQQRVAVARALACDPILVLADEPTASLDPENGSTAVALIRDACRERNAALLFVSHDPAMADRFERRVEFTGLRAGGAR